MGLTEDLKKRPDTITLISIFWTLTGIIYVNQAIQALTFNIPLLSQLPDLYDLSADVWLDLSMESRDWLSFGLPVEIILNLLILVLGLVTLIIVFGLFTGKSWSYKPALAIPVFSFVLSVIASVFYSSAPFELYYDPDLTMNVIFIGLSAVWMFVGCMISRKDSNWAFSERTNSNKDLGQIH